MTTRDDRLSTWSMRVRALLTGALVVAAFLLLVGLALERAYRDSAIETGRERLESYAYMLMSAAEIEEAGAIDMPTVLPSPELSVPGSGVLAAITDDAGTVLWRSESSLDATPVYPGATLPGQAVFGTATTGDGTALYTLSYPLIWELGPGNDYGLIFHVAEDQAQIDLAVAAFRDTLQFWLGGAALLLLLLQLLLLVWVMRPLRRVAEEVADIEQGQREQLTGSYPRELLPLTQNLNAMLQSSRAHTNRYRNALADLAHSLKTPLAVMRNQSSTASSDEGVAFREQLDRMDATIGYQLQRAALSGRSPLAGRVAIEPTLDSVVASLRKVYHAKDLSIATDLQPGVQFQGDAGDLAELLGNLGDNACKWCKSQVRISAVNESGVDGQERLVLCVEDDGPGISASLRELVTQRGIRADSGVPGQGIGLAIVRDIVEEAYGGELRVDTSSLGGACVRITL